MTRREDMAWCGGLFEGEGTTAICVNRIQWFTRTMHLSMTDEETVRRFAEVVGIGKVYGPYNSPTRTGKPMYTWKIVGFEKVQAIAAMLWPWLGIRRREQIRQTLSRVARGRA